MREGSLLLAQAFEQDPDNPFVLLLLAHLCLRQGFMEKVCASRPVSRKLCMFTHCSMLRVLQARQLAQTVLQHGGHNSVQAEALTILARAHHALGHMQEAFRCYQQVRIVDRHCSCFSATLFDCVLLLPLLLPSHALHLLQAAQLDPKLPLPKLGLAQMSVFVGEPINAVSMLESLLMDAPQWIDALQV